MRAKLKARSGAVAPLMAILMVVIIALVAFAVDVAWLVLVQSELQNAADAGALSGATELGNAPLTWNTLSTKNVANMQALMTYENSMARRAAQSTAQQNNAAHTAAAVASADVQVGYTDSAGVFTNYGTLPSAIADPIPWANTVRVTVRRDGTAGTNRVNLFFARVLGRNDQALTAFAESRITFGGAVEGFNSPTGGANGTILPVAVKVTDWEDFVAGNRGEGDNVLSTGSSGQDGINEIQIYPDKSGSISPGNVGDLSLRWPDTSNDVPSLRNWILNGPSPSDLQSFGSDGLHAGSLAYGNPGLRSTLVNTYQQIIGQNRVIPLYDTTNGAGGNNLQYNIVGFAAVTVVYAEGNGNNMTIRVQPANTNDPTAYTNSNYSTQYSYNILGTVKLVK